MLEKLICYHCPLAVLKSEAFLNASNNLPQEAIQDLNTPFIHFLSDRLAEEFHDALINYPLMDLTNFLRRTESILDVMQLMLMGAYGLRDMLRKP